MAKTLVDIPEEKLAEAMANLGAKSKRETIEMALDLINRQAAQRRFLTYLKEGGSPDFTPELVARLRGKSIGLSEDALPG